LPRRAKASLPAALLQQLVDAARGGLPNEAVGLLAGDRSFADGGTPTRYVPLTNADQSPYRYSIDAQEQLREWLEIESRDEVVWGIVHSHVASPAVPSATDIELAYFPDSLYLICSLAAEMPVVRAWSITAGIGQEVSLVVD
jgi:proteasome lid subunit RPN8/RPN11